ncbi:MAG: DUF255 domain-containing protein [bacterium]
MRFFRSIFLLLVGWLSLTGPARAGEGGGKVAWRPWSETAFAEARRDHKLVLLDLEAVWCHWCHVMEIQTYAHPEVADRIRRRFIPIRADQDAMPGLANRYRDYGWPATIVFDAEGRELAKRAGFIAPEEMANWLRRLAEDPKSVSPEAEARPTLVKAGVLPPELRLELERRHREAFDSELGGLKLSHKYVDADSLEYALRRAQAGDSAEAARARRTLLAARALLDPAWGGVYQYSHGRDWTHPHFEKIMSFQRDYLRVYSLAYAQGGDPEDLRVARAIQGYLQKFLLSPEGAFYTSQDADVVPGEHAAEYFARGDSERRALGIPRVDKNRYARENGWAIEGLVQVYRATGDLVSLSMAKGAAEWVLKNRRMASTPFAAARWLAVHGRSPAGGFRHGETDGDGPFLGDTLAMGRACLSLYGATGERDWLACAEGAADFIRANFADPRGAGYLSSGAVGPLPAVADVDENIAAARFFNLLKHYSGRGEYQGAAELAMRYLAAPEVALGRLTDPGILLADEESRGVPTHITVIGRKDDAQAGALFRESLRIPTGYLRTEWWDRREGPMPNGDVQYPQLERSAAFLCSQGLCSSPVFQPEEIRGRLQKLAAKGSSSVS